MINFVKHKRKKKLGLFSAGKDPELASLEEEGSGRWCTEEGTPARPRLRKGGACPRGALAAGTPASPQVLEQQEAPVAASAPLPRPLPHRRGLAPSSGPASLPRPPSATCVWAWLPLGRAGWEGGGQPLLVPEGSGRCVEGRRERGRQGAGNNRPSTCLG